MRTAFLIFLAAATACSWAQTSGPTAATRSNINKNDDWLQVEEGPKRSRSSAIGHEFSTSWSYTAGGDLDQGNREIGSLESNTAKAAYTASIPVTDKVAFRTGIDYTRHSFSVPSGTLLPNTLQSLALTLGTDVELNEHWLMRFEMSPGLYSDFHDISSDDFNVPLVLGFTYLVDSRLQWVFGLAIDPLFSNKIQGLSSPVFPGIGVRWQFADQWTLSAILPNPEIQYDVVDKLQLYAGFRILGGSYRLRKDAGDGLGRQDFNNVVVDYQETRGGLGLRYQFHPALSLEAEGGYTIGRSFTYKNDDGLKYDGGSAPYVQIGLKGRF
jgi:hypothetical protein